jgi:hypothetical protein
MVFEIPVPNKVSKHLKKEQIMMTRREAIYKVMACLKKVCCTQSFLAYGEALWL